jgi:hypothetical protein
MRVVAAAKVEERRTAGVNMCFLGSKAREIALDAVQLEDAKRQPWLDAIEEKLEQLGGWGIDFSAVEGEAKLKEVLNVEPRQEMWRISGHDGAKHAVNVLDNVLPVSWCETFIRQHQRIGFAPQREVQMMSLQDGAATDKLCDLNSSEVIAVSSQPLADVLWRRVEQYCPQEVEVRSKSFDHSYGQGGLYRPVGLIPEFRFVRFKRGQRWIPHIDQMKLIRVNPLRAGRRSSPKKGGSNREDSRSYQSMATVAVFLNELPPDESAAVEEEDTCTNYLAGMYSSFQFKKVGASFNPLLSGGAAGFALRFVRKFAPSSVASEVGHGSFKCTASVTPAPGRCAIFLHKELHEYSFSEDAVEEERKSKRETEERTEGKEWKEGKEGKEGKEAEDQEDDGEVPCFASEGLEEAGRGEEEEEQQEEQEGAATSYLVLCDVLYERFAPWEEQAQAQ